MLKLATMLLLTLIIVSCDLSNNDTRDYENIKVKTIYEFSYEGTSNASVYENDMLPDYKISDEGDNISVKEAVKIAENHLEKDKVESMDVILDDFKTKNLYIVRFYYEETLGGSFNFIINKKTGEVLDFFCEE